MFRQTNGLVMRSIVQLAVCCLAWLLISSNPSIGSEKEVDLRLGKIRVNKVAILGNSITLHGPLEKIGWLNNWGMAASAKEKDFAHLLLKRVEEASGGKPEAYIRNIADFERGYSEYEVRAKLKEVIDFRADLIIVAIGENVSKPETDAAKETYRSACENLLKALDHSGNPTIIVRSCFWSDSVKDGLIREAASEVGAEYVDLKGLDGDERNYARSERNFDHAGVAAHPGDRGMSAIADAIWGCIERRAGLSQP